MANTIINGENYNFSLSDEEQKQRYFLHHSLSTSYSKILGNPSSEDKEIKYNGWEGMDETVFVHRWHDYLWYAENRKELTKLLELINNHSNAVENKVNIPKSNYFPIYQQGTSEL